MRRYKRGVTLVEVMVSIFIVSFLLVGMMRLYSVGAIQSTLAKHRVMAANLAQAEIEGLRNTSYEDMVPADYPLTQTVKIDTGTAAAAADDINGTMVTNIYAVAEGYKIVVNITWNDYYGPITEVLESTITSYL
ncbi:MAG: prepilin-type N-terminal cleavage/methylation domain-containing protein [Candidatus Omnitrophota bacterium]